MVGFIGAGRMAQVLSGSITKRGLIKPENVISSDVIPKMLKQIGALGVKTTTDNKEVVRTSKIVCLAVKPIVVAPILREISTEVTRDHLIVSIAAGVSTRTLERLLPPQSRVVRVMTNTPCLVNEGCSVFSPGQHALPADLETVSKLFSNVGICEDAPEYLMDTVTGLSGSGPAYAYVAVEALADGAVEMGLTRETAQRLAAQAMLGAAKMVLETGKSPGQLKDEVCSAGGTTIAAIHSLEKGGFRGVLMDAVVKSTIRSREIGKKLNDDYD
ncbi:pyrroline-5-carboxylate reductase 2-like [Tubulanus polymorphus]|uniref:pyrroline-5-carboxylate reductase 2-like n=1 Tax=Tubulanus polymorphus TaxID=672921 RepID=UPI003DA2215F